MLCVVADHWSVSMLGHGNERYIRAGLMIFEANAVNWRHGSCCQGTAWGGFAGLKVRVRAGWSQEGGAARGPACQGGGRPPRCLALLRPGIFILLTSSRPQTTIINFISSATNAFSTLSSYSFMCHMYACACTGTGAGCTQLRRAGR